MAQFIHNTPYVVIAFCYESFRICGPNFKYKVSALDFTDKDINNNFKKRVKDCIVYTRNTPN